MKRTWPVLAAAVIGLLVLPLLLVRASFASHCDDDRRVMGGSGFSLDADEVLDQNLIVLGGSVNIADGARVTCSVVIVGGSLTLAGTVDEDVVVFGGSANLQDTAVIEGELVTVGGDIQRDPESIVRGGESEGFGVGRDPRDDWFPFRDRIPFLSPVLGFYRTVLEAFVSAVGLGLLALLVMLFWPEQTARVSAAVTSAPGASGGLGLLTAIAVPVLIAVTVVTICLAPLGFVGAILYAAAMVFGWIALGHVVGARLAPLLLAAIGLGAVTLTRFGTQPYLPGGPAQILPPAPPAPAMSSGGEAAALSGSISSNNDGAGGAAG